MKKKCLLYKSQFDIDEALKSHYYNFHNLDQGNYFFKKLFKKTLRCDEFLQTSKFKEVHDFIKYYSEGKNVSAQDRPINIGKLGRIKIYTVSLVDHKKLYNFEDPHKLIDTFLLNVKSKCVRSTEVSIRCGFWLENIQPAPVETGVLISNLKYSLTDVYTMKYFIDYLFFILKRDLK